MSRRDYTADDARDALQHCDPGTDRRQWVRILASAAPFEVLDVPGHGSAW